jgi:hypothetical protein
MEIDSGAASLLDEGRMKRPWFPALLMVSIFLNTGCGALLHPLATAGGLARSAASSASGAAHGMVGAARTATNFAVGGAKTAARAGAKAVGKAAEVAPYAAAAAL